jgi:hypothetical protein
MKPETTSQWAEKTSRFGSVKGYAVSIDSVSMSIDSGSIEFAQCRSGSTCFSGFHSSRRGCWRPPSSSMNFRFRYWQMRPIGRWAVSRRRSPAAARPQARRAAMCSSSRWPLRSRAFPRWKFHWRSVTGGTSSIRTANRQTGAHPGRRPSWCCRAGGASRLWCQFASFAGPLPGVLFEFSEWSSPGCCWRPSDARLLPAGGSTRPSG